VGWDRGKTVKWKLKKGRKKKEERRGTVKKAGKIKGKTDNKKGRRTGRKRRKEKERKGEGKERIRKGELELRKGKGGRGKLQR
jgi:hypothetical protein